jgi:hypothetical protein
MKTLITALTFAIVIVAPGLTEPADARAAARKTEPAAAKLGRDSFSPGKTRNVIGGGNATSSTMKIPGFTIEVRSILRTVKVLSDGSLKAKRTHVMSRQRTAWPNSYHVSSFVSKPSFSIICITSSTLSRTSEWPFSSCTLERARSAAPVTFALITNTI